jgi:PleD family two-component response regulator
MLTRAQIRAGRILVVDDAESDVAVARGILRAAGYEEVLAAERSADAASLYAEPRATASRCCRTCGRSSPTPTCRW